MPSVVCGTSSVVDGTHRHTTRHCPPNAMQAVARLLGGVATKRNTNRIHTHIHTGTQAKRTT